MADEKALPPCPGSVDGPPGHSKTAAPKERPCRPGEQPGDPDATGGMVIVLPGLAAIAAFADRSRRRARTLAGGRLRSVAPRR